MPENPRLNALRELTSARVKEFLREPEAVFWVFLFPVLLAIVLGFAFREKPPDRIPIGVISSPASGKAITALSGSSALLPKAYAADEGRDALRTGKISLLVEPGPPVVFHLDETRPDSRIARLAADDALQRAAGRADPLPVRDEKVTEKGSRYIDFLIPGLLGMNLMGTGIWSLAFSITSARSRRVLKRLVATPMRRGDYLLSQILGRLAFLLPEILLLAGFGWFAFDVPMRGSLLLFLAVCLLGTMSFCGLGLLIASRVRTVEGVSGLANFVMMPMWLVSGVFFSTERFPDAIQPLIRSLPLTALNESLRGIMNEGQGLAEIAPQMAIIAAWGLVSFAVALKIFRWK
ncbi:MAG: type transport system permease protein [Acidobacteriota bacterium]|jgi:ABC-type multidrug transport system permease subunit|nr:type transport system permease protein [Acidobacteriota bacterium]